ncbi:MAG: hypothetical protein ACI9HK_000437 [Pirellulaceae bacterium]|jgi:hypothetical protein
MLRAGYSFEMLRTRLNFSPRVNLRDGIQELASVHEQLALVSETFSQRHYRRWQQLRFLLENERLDGELRSAK